MGKRSFACLGCKKLKIKCDLVRPRCEYCLARDKQCVYPDDDESPRGLVSSALSMAEELPVLRVLPLNAPSRQLGLTLQEQELLNFLLYRIQTHYAPQRESEPICAVFSYEFPGLFLESPMTRTVLLAYGQMRLLGCYPHKLDYLIKRDSLWLDSLTEQDIRSIAEGFAETIGWIKLLMVEMLTLDWRLPNTRSRILELAVSNLYVFEFLAVHPHQLVPLVLFTGGLDFMGIVKGIQEFFTTFAPVLMQTKIASFYLPFEFTTEPMDAKFLQLMADIQADDVLCPDDRNMLVAAITMLWTLLHQLRQLQSSISLYKWIIIHCNSAFMHLVVAKQFSALRVLFTFACCAIEFHMYVLAYLNIWSDFIGWFHWHNLEMGGWVFADDAAVFDAVRLWQADVPTTT